MRASIRRVRLAAAGWIVSWHPIGFPRDIRASVIPPGKLPPGHEWLTADAEVELQLDRDGGITRVRQPRPPWRFGRETE